MAALARRGGRTEGRERETPRPRPQACPRGRAPLMPPFGPCRLSWPGPEARSQGWWHLLGRPWVRWGCRAARRGGARALRTGFAFFRMAVMLVIRPGMLSSAKRNGFRGLEAGLPEKCVSAAEAMMGLFHTYLTI